MKSDQAIEDAFQAKHNRRSSNNNKGRVEDTSRKGKFLHHQHK